MQKRLQEAQAHILSLINQQEALSASSIEVPQK
jgi:hypothetical protein